MMHTLIFIIVLILIYFLVKLLNINVKKYKFLKNNFNIRNDNLIFVNIHKNSEILIYNKCFIKEHYGGKKYQSNSKSRTLKKLNKILQNNPSINYRIILLNIPSKIKAYYNESEIKNIKYGQYLYNFQFYDYLSENIKI